MKLFFAFIVMAITGLCLTATHAAERQTERPIEQSITLLDASGNIHSLEPRARSAVRVYVFLTGECPISKSCIPSLNRLWDQWQSEHGTQVLMHAVWADTTTGPAEIAKFAGEHEMRFPVLVDRDGELAARLKPTHVPEAFVLDAEGNVAYRGRIDDRYLEIGRRRPEATEHTLADAVTAVVQSRAVSSPYSKPVGCYYEAPPATREAADVTYTRDVAPILFANCVTCHREGEVGPFALTSYQDAAKRAKQIVRVVDRGLMPPWKAAETHGEFEGQRTLTSRQIEVLKAWTDAGRAEGSPSELPALPQFSSGWRLGEPDLVVEMQDEFEVPADGPDLFQNFVIPIDIPEDKLVAVADFIPGNPRVVHHCLLLLDSNHVARKLDSMTPEPGYPSFGDPGFLPTGSIGGWSPGKTPRRLPNQLGRYLKKGSDLVVQIHYHPNGKVEKDRSKIGIYFVDKPAGVAVAIWASAFTHDIPPGESNYRVAASYTLPTDVLMLGCVPHMHLLGREMRAVAKLPDGTQRQLIHVPDWDFNWQDEYHFARPFKMPKGTQLDVEAFYDNSSDNPSNPSSPPQRVTWGEGTTDEMLYCFFFVATDDSRETPLLMRDVLKREILGKAAAGVLK